MDKVITVFILVLVLVSCKKDNKCPDCIGTHITGNHSFLVGKWQWYNTRVEEWFDVGTPIYHNYTPENQGFEYYFTISSDGKYNGYKNDTLVNSHFLNKVKSSNFDNNSIHFVGFELDCSANDIVFHKAVNNITKDSIYTFNYPLDFIDEENHLESKLNFFVKVE